MMVRKIIHIEEEKCNGCGLCAEACHEGAIDIIDGKAKLVREHFCDGLGDCLPNCPTGAITFEEREAPAYDEAAVKASQLKKMEEQNAASASCCDAGGEDAGSCCDAGAGSCGVGGETVENCCDAGGEAVSRLGQWPCQIKLLPVQADFFAGADLLIAADCTAYAYASMHERFMKNKITLIGCPKLDAIDYSEKLTDIIKYNDINSVTLVRMEVPCCGGLQRAMEIALRNSGKLIPSQVVIISCGGEILR